MGEDILGLQKMSWYLCCFLVLLLDVLKLEVGGLCRLVLWFAEGDGIKEKEGKKMGSMWWLKRMWLVVWAIGGVWLKVQHANSCKKGGLVSCKHKSAMAHHV